MQKFNFLFVILFFGCLFLGCDKDETPIPESEDIVLKAATMDKITITKTLPNGKVITIQIPADAAETMIANSEKLPYSPQGTYLFMLKDKWSTYDVFISSFDGTKFSGTYGYPSGGNYEYTGDITGEKSGVDGWGFQRFTGKFSNGDRESFPIEFATSESDGIIKNSHISKPNMFLVLTTEPYSPEGWYRIGEYLNESQYNDGTSSPYLEYTILITSFDGNNFKGKYLTQKHKSEVYFYGKLEGSIGVIKDNSAPISMDLFEESEGNVILYKTITGNVDVDDGLFGLDFPFKIIPVKVVD